MKSAFDGDTVAEAQVVKILRQHNVHTVLETGTYEGVTTRFFSKHCSEVITIELNKNNFDALKLSDLPNVQSIQGSSPLVMKRVLPTVQQPLFCYLDAHFYTYWPLLDELKMIAECGLQPILMIHDFQVPHTQLTSLDNRHLGFDVYKGQPLNFDYVESSLKKIYPTCRCQYNDDTAKGARRGILYVFPAASKTNA